jgi:hypothetical protein
MTEEKKANKKQKTVTLKPINIAWLAQRSFDESTPENKVSDSEIVDRLIDQARAREESPSPAAEKKTKSQNALSAPRVAVAI